MLKWYWIGDNVRWNEWLYSSHTMCRMAAGTLELWLLNCKDTWIRETYEFYVAKTYEMETCIINLRLLDSWDVDFHVKISTLTVLRCLELEKLQLQKLKTLWNLQTLRNIRLEKLSSWETYNLTNLKTWEAYNWINIQLDKLKIC